MDTNNLAPYGSEEDTWTPLERKELLCQMASRIASGNIQWNKEDSGVGRTKHLVLDEIRTSRQAIRIAKEIMKNVEEEDL